MGLLELQDISVRFGGIAALDSVTLSIDSGIVSGLIGPNGAGKTTLFNVITGFQRANSGSVVLGGTNVSKLRPYQRARLGLGRTFQRLELFGSLTVRENVLVAAETQHSSGANVPTSELVGDCLKRLGEQKATQYMADVDHFRNEIIDSGNVQFQTCRSQLERAFRDMRLSKLKVSDGIQNARSEVILKYYLERLKQKESFESIDLRIHQIKSKADQKQVIAGKRCLKRDLTYSCIPWEL